MIKRLLPNVVTVAALASIAYTLTLLDQIVHGTLYSYGLQFSLDWANPYWTLLRITLALLAICTAATIANVILIVRASSREKQRSIRTAPIQKAPRNIPVATQARERTATASVAHSPSPQPSPLPKPVPKPTPMLAPTPSYTSPEAPSLFKCAHCGKTFTQPLRMLNFQVDPPRIVNVCPFCNETMPSGSTVKESEQDENKTFFRRNNGHAQRPLTQ